VVVLKEINHLGHITLFNLLKQSCQLRSVFKFCHYQWT
jgi:hypothetical protein